MREFILPSFFESNVPLRERGYYAIGGTARFLARPESITDLSALLFWNREHRLPLAIMGKGSNIIFSDEDFPGIVLSLEGMERISWLSEEELLCEAGADNTLIAEELLKSGRSGGEWLYRLPGQIGSTVRMNARCFGGEVSAITAGILTLSLDGRLSWKPPEEVFHGYKHTALMENPEIVVAVVLRFPTEKAECEIRRQMYEHKTERDKKHHFDYPSCGSTFKNNYEAGRSSGRIFEELGFKGMVEGGAMVSLHHANFIYNRGEATAADVLRLAGRMRSAALERASVELDLEVQCIGRFDRTLLELCGVRCRADRSDPGKAWAGLLYSPDDIESETALPCFPVLLVEGRLVGYSFHDRELPAGGFAAVEQLRSLEDGVSDPEAPFLRWTTLRTESALFACKPPLSLPGGSFVEGLWQYGVSELFIGQGGAGEAYLEFEMTPEGHWVALRFEARRRRAKGYEALSAEPWISGLTMVNEKDRFGLEFSYALLEPFIADSRVSLQCCASSGRGEYGLFPWWNNPSSPADFHQPDKFFRVTLS
ncbi:UDP-N-acetylmuramate dehydrogenase [Chlorobium sp. KB01]|uniref:UDP-N-acetylmuramate dehydrogenase n=1 Tax=Chlorobium sp. KB01 TaxID=1917528 RepID=UPI0009788FF9|nr:UDP-N-acetylmuramate dehydrogenase [Chlorobium sp. KB01]